MTRITTVFFDFGGTLVEALRPVEVMWREVARRVGLAVDLGTLMRAVEDANARFGGSIYDYHGRMKEYWALHDAFVLERVGRPDPDGMLAAAVERTFKEILLSPLYPETRGVLADLRSRSYRIGLVSNATDDLLPRLAALGLTQWFDAVTYSQEARAEKPNPAIFELAMRKIGCLRSEVIHVGDRPEADVAGARAAGITPVLVDRQGTHPTEDCVRIQNLREVLPILEGLRAERS